MGWMTLPELYDAAASAFNYAPNGLDCFLRALDGIIDEFISNFYDTKVVCGLADYSVLQPDVASVTSGKLQFMPTRIDCVHINFPDGEAPEGTPADGVDEYCFEYCMVDKDRDRNILTASTLSVNGVIVFDGHIMCCVQDIEQGQIQAPTAGIIAAVEGYSGFSGGGFSIDIGHTALDPVNTVPIDISLLAQGSLASVTPVDETVDVVIPDNS